MDIKRINSIDKKIKKESLSKENHICIASKFGISCNELAVKSHSYWKKGMIDYLAVDNKVLTLGFDEVELIKTNVHDSFYKEVSVKSASTFGGFCRTHDNQIFSLIENNNCIPPYSIEQQFLFMVRTLSYQYVHEKDSQDWINRSIQKPYPKQIVSDSEWAGMERKFRLVKMYTEKEDNILTKLAPWFDNAKKCFGQEKKEISFDTDNINRLFRFKSYEIKGNLDFAAMGIYTPELIHNRTERNDMAIFNIIPHSNGGYLLICYLPNSFIEENIIKQIDNFNNADITGDCLKAIIQNLVIQHTENIILSPRINQSRLNMLEQQFKKSCRDSIYLRNEKIPIEIRMKIAESMTLFKWVPRVLFE